MKNKKLVTILLISISTLTLFDLVSYTILKSILGGVIIFSIPVIIILVALTIYILIKSYYDLDDWYGQLLDSIPNPISVTDIDMNWTFINKPVKDIIGVERDEIVGQQCSRWGADICETPKCGVMMLRNGDPRSYFTNEGLDMNFQVDTNYLYHRKDKTKKIGHIEIVSDVTIKSRLDKAVTQLKKSSIDLKETIELEASATEELSATSVQFSQNLSSISNNTTKQFNVIEDTVTALEEMSASIESVSQNSSKASVLSRENVNVARIGEGKIKDTLHSISGINESLEHISNKINSLNEKTQKVDEILKVINSVSAQTNLLSMNAAIEAAHAGESGKGFSVVANEIGKLAESAQASSKRIDQIIKEIKIDVVETKELSDDSHTKAEQNINNINESLDAINNIVDTINSVDNMVNSIDSAASEQAKATGTILENAKNLKSISHEITDSIKEQSEGINQITNALQGLVEETNKNARSSEELNEIANKLEL
ncbi:MAG: methyl-accepting chemotaxis protein [Spirochaetaceae bacterium]